MTIIILKHNAISPAPLCKPPRSMKRLDMYEYEHSVMYSGRQQPIQMRGMYAQLSLSLLTICRTPTSTDFNADALLRYDMWDARTELERESVNHASETKVRVIYLIKTQVASTLD